jgi:GTP pyrophosphokinase
MAEPTTSSVPAVTPSSGSSDGLRSRLARIAGRPPSAPAELEPVLRQFRRYHPKTDTDVIIKAYRTAAVLHAEQLRRSGEPYITHPLAVAGILADLGMTASTLAAALLHDTVEDTGYDLEQLREDFGDEIANLVDGVTKLDKVSYGEASAAETVRKMVVAMARDIRVLVIKLADRLHNMRTITWLPQEKQDKKARETLEIYAPLAHRLGMNTVKWELEDLSFATLYPKMYEEIVRLVGQRAPERERALREVIDVVEDELRGSKIKATVSGRPKHYYSVYQKMIVRGRDFADIYDLVGVRILVDDIRDCYATLGVIHAKWNPLPGRFKDYIAMPKFNMYRSLHTTVIGPGGRPVEFQIRTQDMHRESEFGVAAHWRYKQRDVGGNKGPDDMGWLRQLLEWQRETEDPDEFLDSLRYDLASQEVFVFTPKGDVVALPAGATPVDFAFAVHTEVGYHCVGARVNDRLVSLDSVLKSGDVIDILTTKSETAGPSRDWLDFVKSPRARNKIRAWFSREQRDENIEIGKDAIVRVLRKQGLPLQRLMVSSTMQALAADFRYKDVATLYAVVGEGKLGASAVVERLITLHGGVDGASEDLAEATTPTRARKRPARPDDGGSISVTGADGLWVKLARCCTPVPGDPILGFVTRGSGVSVHRTDCTNAESLRRDAGRLVEVQWNEGARGVFLVSMQVEALDRPGLLSDITRALSEQHVNILSATVSTMVDRTAISRFSFEMADAKHLGSVLKAVRGVEGVYDVSRV